MDANRDHIPTDEVSSPEAWALRVDTEVRALRMERQKLLARLSGSCLETTNQQEVGKELATEPEAEAPPSQQVEMQMSVSVSEPESETVKEHNEAGDSLELNTKPESEEEHNEAGDPLELPYNVRRAPQRRPPFPPHGPVPFRGPPVFVPLHQRLQHAHYALNQERHMRFMAERARHLERQKWLEATRKLQEERSLRLKCEEEIERLKSVPSTAPPSELDQSAEITKLTDQLQAEKQQADVLQTKLQEVRGQLKDTLTQGLRLVERLREDKQALEQQMKEVTCLQREKEEVFAAQLEELKEQLQKQISSNLELTCELTAQREATRAQQRKNHALQQEMMSQITYEPLSNHLQPAGDSREDNAPQDVPEQQQEVSLWRRFKKFVTPKHLRQYKERANRE